MDIEKLEENTRKVAAFLDEKNLDAASALLNEAMTRQERIELALRSELYNQSKQKINPALPDLTICLKYLGSKPVLERVTSRSGNTDQTLYSDGALSNQTTAKVEIDGGRLTRIVFPDQKGTLHLGWDRSGLEEVVRNEQTMLKRVGPPLDGNGHGLWRTLSGDIVQARVTVSADHDVIFEIAAGDRYLFKKSGTVERYLPNGERHPDEKPAEQPTLQTFNEWFQKNLSRLDTDHDQAVSADEVAAATEKRMFSITDAPFIATLRSRFGEVDYQSRLDFRVSAADMNALEEAGAFADESCAEIGKTLTLFHERTRNHDPRLWGGFGKAEDAISAEAIGQGEVGDCWLMSVLAAIAETSPSTIKNMIEERDDGTFAVRFPGRKDPVTVTRPTATEMALYAKADEHGIWPVILERACARIRTHKRSHDRSEIQRLSGGTPEEAFFTLTGRRGLVFTIDPNDSLDSQKRAAIELLTTAKQWNLPVIASTRVSFVPESPDGMANTHAFTVLNFDPDTEMVTIRNPWDMKSHAAGTGATFTWPLKKVLDNIHALWTVTP